MLRTVFYGPHTVKPWCPGTGYLDKDAKSLKSYRSREPHSIWQSLQAKTEDLGEYDLYICRHCFLYTSKSDDIVKHEKVCRYRNGPPGKQVFEDSKYKILEVQVPPETSVVNTSQTLDGPPSSNPKYAPYFSTTPSGVEFNSVKLYLQSLSLFGSLFLDTKSICFCVDAFMFYVAIDKSNEMVAGFFSKERHSWHDYNLACIVIFPPWQHHGLGQRLITFSYLLSQRNSRYGSPEKPLSKHGQLAYHRYWRKKFTEYVHSNSIKNKSNNTFTLEDVSKETGIDPMDLVDTLKNAGALNEKEGVVRLKEVVKKITKQPR